MSNLDSQSVRIIHICCWALNQKLVPIQDMCHGNATK